MTIARNDAARPEPGVGVTSLARLDDTTSDSRQVQANRCGMPLRAHQDIIVVASMFRPETLNGFADVLDPDMFTDELPRALALEAAELIRKSGTCSALLVGEKVKATGRFSEREIADYVDRIVTDWEPSALPAQWVQDAAAALINHAKAMALHRALENGRHQLSNSNMTPDEILAELVSIPAYKTPSLQESNWEPVRASELTGGEGIKWAWYGYLAAEHLTLFTGLSKVAGKTTLLAHLLVALEHGGDLAGTVMPGGVLVVSEESAALWQRRITDLGIGDHAEFLIRPFKLRPTQRQWEQFIDSLAGLVREHEYAVVIFDTLSTLWPVTNENDAAETLTALTPLHRLTEAGAAVLLVHHPRKSEGDQGKASRGSGALPGFVDIIVELRRFDPQRRDDRRRVLTTYSRFDETPGEVVIELTDDGYTAVGTRAESSRQDRMEVIAELLPDTEPGLTAAEVRDQWPDDGIPKPGPRSLHADLLYGYEQRRWQRTGEGKKGNPFRFLQGNTYRGAGIESEGHEGPAT